MSRTLLLVGTRKGLFALESDADRRKWSMRGPYCEAWPVYHAVFDQDSGAIYAAAASEWHGSSIWRSGDLGETWTQSSEGLAYEDGRKLSKVSSLAAGHGRVLVGVEAPGILESRDDGATWSPYSMLAGQPERVAGEGRDDPRAHPYPFGDHRCRGEDRERVNAKRAHRHPDRAHSSLLGLPDQRDLLGRRRPPEVEADPLADRCAHDDVLSLSRPPGA